MAAGRYDTGEHTLFEGRDTVHKDDWYNECIPPVRTECVRQPWHDVHARIEGSAARDVMRNFEERWRSQCSDAHSLLFGSGAGHVGSQQEAPDGAPGALCCVQLFRSIDGRSALLDQGHGFPALHYKKGRPVDSSIHSACAASVPCVPC